MITEIDVIEHLNKKVEADELTPTLKRYVTKIKELENLKKIQEKELAGLKAQIKQVEDSLLKTQGAISVLLELAAEDDGLLPPAKILNNPDDEAKSK